MSSDFGFYLLFVRLKPGMSVHKLSLCSPEIRKYDDDSISKGNSRYPISNISFKNNCALLFNPTAADALQWTSVIYYSQ